MATIRGLQRGALTLAWALLAATAANAQSTNIWTTDFQKAFMTEKTMHMMDRSGKGEVTREDYDGYMGKVFDMMDRKHRGMLDKDDFVTLESASTNIWTTDFQKTFRTVEMMHTMDNGKGMVNKADFMAHMGRIFDMLDKNHDGKLEKSEFDYEQVFGRRR